MLFVGGESLYPETMYGSFYVQKQISGTSEIPIELHLGDHKYTTIEKIKIGSSSVIGVIITRNPAFLFRKSLRFSLNEFKSKYGSNYDEISTHVGYFKAFYSKLQKIFNQTLPPIK